jgi:hypothetical protein
VNHHRNAVFGARAQQVAQVPLFGPAARGSPARKSRNSGERELRYNNAENHLVSGNGVSDTYDGDRKRVEKLALSEGRYERIRSRAVFVAAGGTCPDLVGSPALSSQRVAPDLSGPLRTAPSILSHVPVEGLALRGVEGSSRALYWLLRDLLNPGAGALPPASPPPG